MATRRRLVLAGLILVLVATLLAGSAAQPLTVRSAAPRTYCQWVWDSGLMLWCYRCCDVYGCYYVECV